MSNTIITILELLLVKLNTSWVNIYSKLALGKFIKAIKIIDNLKANILLSNDIFIPESINLFIRKKKIIISSY